MAALTCPACGTPVGSDDLICFTCGTNLPKLHRADDPPLDVTAAQKSISRPPGTAQISAMVLRIAFPTGNVEIPAGTSVVLGRDPSESLVAAAFATSENVSRRHAVITVDDGGHATIRDEGSTNGTYVNNDRLLPGIDVRLVDGDTVRLAADVSGRVAIPRQEPDAATLS